METWENFTDNEDEECSLSQYQKARLQEESDVEKSDYESYDVAVESEGSAGPPSMVFWRR